MGQESYRPTRAEDSGLWILSCTPKFLLLLLQQPKTEQSLLKRHSGTNRLFSEPAREMTIIMLQDDINILTYILAAAVQWADCPGKMLRYVVLPLGNNACTPAASRRAACGAIPGDVATPRIAAAPIWSQSPPTLGSSPPFCGIHFMVRQWRALKATGAERFSVSV